MVKSIEESVREIIQEEYYRPGTTREEMFENLKNAITAFVEKRERKARIDEIESFPFGLSIQETLKYLEARLAEVKGNNIEKLENYKI